MYQHLYWEVLMWDRVSGLPAAQVGNILSSPLITVLPSLPRSVTSSWSFIKLVKHDFSLVKPCSPRDHFLILICLKCFWGSTSLPHSQELGWGWPVCSSLGPPFLPSLKMGMIFSFLVFQHSSQSPQSIKDFPLPCVLWHKLLHLLAAFFGSPSGSDP